MQRVLVIGCSGAGKSTLARQLAARLDLPVHHLDRLFWRPGWVQRDPTEFRHDHQDLLRHPRWIIDGNYTSTLAERLAACDTVLFLDFPTSLCFWRILKRRFSRAPRTDMSEGCPERFDWEFYRYVLGFRRHHRPRVEQLLAEASGCAIHRLRSQSDLHNFLSAL
jgi:adenylate kinase family enzyme